MMTAYGSAEPDRSPGCRRSAPMTAERARGPMPVPRARSARRWRSVLRCGSNPSSLSCASLLLVVRRGVGDAVPLSTPRAARGGHPRPVQPSRLVLKMRAKGLLRWAPPQCRGGFPHQRGRSTDADSPGHSGHPSLWHGQCAPRLPISRSSAVGSSAAPPHARWRSVVPAASWSSSAVSRERRRRVPCRYAGDAYRYPGRPRARRRSRR